jgi:hypothetical protein
MENLVKLLEKNETVNNQTVNVYLKLKDSEILIDAPFETVDFVGGLKEFATVVNRITKPFKYATNNKCFLSIEWIETVENETVEKTIDFIFFAGKFAPKMTTIVDALAQTNRVFGTDKTKFKALKSQVVDYFNTNINGFMNTLEFIDFIESTPLDKLYLATKKANITLIDATNDAK